MQSEVTNTLPASVAIASPDMSVIGKAVKASDAARGLAVDSATMYEIAATDLQKIKGIAKEVEEARTSLKRPILEAGKAIDAFFRAPLDWLATAEGSIKVSMLAYKRDEDRKTAAAQAERDKAVADERARLEAQAKEAAKAGDVERAEALRQTADVITAPVVSIGAPKAAGISTQRRWNVTVTDKAALLRYIAEHPEGEAWITINEAQIARFVTSTSGRVPLPGCTFNHDEIMSARAA